MKLLFVIENMELGGTRSSLISLLKNFRMKNDIEVHLLVLSGSGVLYDQFSNHVNLISTSFLLDTIFRRKNELLKKPAKLLVRSILVVLERLLGYERVYPLIYKYATKKYTNYGYDAVIGYQEGPSNDVASFISAKRRLLWIHNEYKNFSGASRYKGLPISYEKADKVVFVAEASMEDFLETFPQYTKKCTVIKNTIDRESIINKSYQECEYHYNTKGIKLITVGRAVGNQKGYDRLIEAADELLREGIVFEWIVVGGGDALTRLVEEVNNKLLSKYVRFIGPKLNPYSIMREADIYVMTSRYESQPIVLLEALSIGRPVITTKFKSAEEMVGGCNYAIIVDNSSMGIAEGIRSVANLGEKLQRMTDSVSEFEYNNEKIVTQLLETLA